jgi:hypothetical protein
MPHGSQCRMRARPGPSYRWGRRRPSPPTFAYRSIGCCCTSVSNSSPDRTGAARLLAVQSSTHTVAKARWRRCCSTSPMMYSLSRGARRVGVLREDAPQGRVPVRLWADRRGQGLQHGSWSACGSSRSLFGKKGSPTAPGYACASHESAPAAKCGTHPSIDSRLTRMCCNSASTAPEGRGSAAAAAAADAVAWHVCSRGRCALRTPCRPRPSDHGAKHLLCFCAVARPSRALRLACIATGNVLTTTIQPRQGALAREQQIS